MPLGFMPLIRLKRSQACGQWHSSRVFTPLTGGHCKLCPNTVGTNISTSSRNSNTTVASGKHKHKAGANFDAFVAASMNIEVESAKHLLRDLLIAVCDRGLLASALFPCSFVREAIHDR
jgi:hypothetical protein